MNNLNLLRSMLILATALAAFFLLVSACDTAMHYQGKVLIRGQNAQSTLGQTYTEFSGQCDLKLEGWENRGCITSNRVKAVYYEGPIEVKNGKFIVDRVTGVRPYSVSLRLRCPGMEELNWEEIDRDHSPVFIDLRTVNQRRLP